MRLLALATVSAAGRPQVDPVDGIFLHGSFHFGSAPDSARAGESRAAAIETERMFSFRMPAE